MEMIRTRLGNKKNLENISNYGIMGHRGCGEETTLFLRVALNKTCLKAANESVNAAITQNEESSDVLSHYWSKYTKPMLHGDIGTIIAHGIQCGGYCLLE